MSNDAGLPDESILVEDLLQDLPPERSGRERVLHLAALDLGNFLGRADRPLPSHLEARVLRLTRDALVHLYQGFRLGTFRGISGIPRAPGEPPAAQTRLWERLEALARIAAARAEMFRWFLAGLRHEVGPILRERLYSAPPTWDPGRLFVRWQGRLALALEQAFCTPVDDQNPEHEFGLYGLRLLFESTGEIRRQEFQVGSPAPGLGAAGTDDGFLRTVVIWSICDTILLEVFVYRGDETSGKQILPEFGQTACNPGWLISLSKIRL